MKNKELDAVALKRDLQSKAEQKLARLSEREQLELLRRKFGHLIKPPRKVLAPTSQMRKG